MTQKDWQWEKVNKKDGSAKTCKFCHAEVWWNTIERRWYDVGGIALHVENCNLSREYYKTEAAHAAESRRKNK